MWVRFRARNSFSVLHLEFPFAYNTSRANMAISKDLPGVAVIITTGGRDLREYSCIKLEPEDRTVDRLVAATTNQIFTIECTADENTKFHGSFLFFVIHVDGQEIDSQAVKKPSAHVKLATTSSLGLYDTVDTLRRYRFTSVETGMIC